MTTTAENSPLDIGGRPEQNVFQKLFRNGFCQPKNRDVEGEEDDEIAENSLDSFQHGFRHEVPAVVTTSTSTVTSSCSDVRTADPDDGVSLESTDLTPVKAPPVNSNDHSTKSSKIPPELRQRLQFEATKDEQKSETGTSIAVRTLELGLTMCFVAWCCSSLVTFEAKHKRELVVHSPSNESAVVKDSLETITLAGINDSQSPNQVPSIHEPMPSPDNMVASAMSVDWVQEMLEHDLMQEVLDEAALMPTPETMVSLALSVDWMQEMREQDLVQQVLKEALAAQQKMKEETEAMAAEETYLSGAVKTLSYYSEAVYSYVGWTQ